MRHATLAALVAAALLVPLAGCMQGDDSPGATRKGGSESLQQGVDATKRLDDAAASLADLMLSDPTNASAPVPKWAVGDAWTMATGSPEGDSGSATLVVTQDNGGSYTLLATDEELATYDVLFDVSYVGTIRASDLAGAQDGTPVQFFDFPLKDGKSWTTTWDGIEVTLVAKANPAIATPAGNHPGFDIVASRADGTPHVTYDYVPALKWWSRVAFTGGFTITLQSFQPNWTGNVLQATSKELLTLDALGPVTHMPGGAFTVSEGQASVTMVIAGMSKEQVRAMSILGPEGPVMPEGGEDVVVDPQPRSEWRVERLPPTPGSWHVALAALHDPEAWYAFAFHQVAIEEVAVG